MENFATQVRLLLPPPRRATPSRGDFVGPRRVALDLPDETPVPAARKSLELRLATLGVEMGVGAPKVLVGKLVAGLGGEGYSLRIDPDGIEVVASTPAGLAYGLRTLEQWLRVSATAQPGGGGWRVGGLEITDSPSFVHRGLLLDISRNRVPHLAELLHLIEQMAMLKLNQLQLYTEHTFAYVGHGNVWRDASPLTATEIRQLDAECAARGIELVPCQNSFGHFHRWLVHSPYRQLAECPEGITHPFSLRPEPFSLCPIDPRSVALLRDLYGQLLPHFSSRFFNTGLDETLDLGLGRSRAACEERGKFRVYLELLEQVRQLCAAHGRRMMFWGDVILAHPAAIPELPPDAIVLEWGYEADHPFEEDTARFAASGLEFYVCPGTSSWNSFGGRTANLRANLAAAARAGARRGAAGYLLTDWGDHGHLQPPPISWPGYVLGAAASWNAESVEDPTLPWEAWLDLYWGGRLGLGLGKLLLELGEIPQWTGAASRNGSALFFALMFAHRPAAERRGQGMTRAHLAATREALAGWGERLRAARPAWQDGRVAAELGWVQEILELATELADARLERGEDQPLASWPQRTPFRRRLEAAAESLRPLWRARSRVGGLEESVARLLVLRDWVLGEET